MKAEDVSRQWVFWIEYGLGEQRAEIFEGTKEDARNELKRRIEGTWSPFLRHGFDPK